MSGIAGIVRFDGGPVDRALLEKMADFQAFRGPHGRGIWCDGNVGFVHTLFKLNDDDSPAPQPLSLDGKVWITAHARVDAQDELIPALRGRGREVARGASDAELLLHAYHAWGERCLEHVLGDFTFAIWDGRERRLFCAVDHFGIRPLYYAQIGEVLVFSNTLDCVRLLDAVSETLDEIAVGDFLLFGQYADLNRTIYADIRRIPRAQKMLACDGKFDVHRYWELPDEQELDDSDPAVLIEEFRSRLLTATHDRLRTQHVAALMSGGLDSTFVTAMAVKALRSRNAPWRITPFTTVFMDLIADDEEQYARAAAQHLGLNLRLQNGRDFVPFDSQARDVHKTPEPVNDPRWGSFVRGIAEYSQSARLAITGWEGDEPLRAWLPDRWRRLVRARRWKRLLDEVTWYVRHEKGLPPIGARTALVRLRRHIDPPALPDWINPYFVRRAQLRARQLELQYAQPRALHTGSRVRYLDSVPWAGVFDGYDLGWTRCQIEHAHPLMDLRVIAWLARLPALPWCSRKHVFRNAASGLLPNEIVERPKTPLRDDPVEAVFRKKPVSVPRDVVSQAEQCEFVIADKLFDSNGVIHPDRPLSHRSSAISLLIWLASKQGDKLGRRVTANQHAREPRPAIQCVV